jgi:hypothetical protein
MLRRLPRLWLAGLTCLPLVCGAAEAPAVVGPTCGGHQHEVPLATETGSVGIVQNIAEDPSSIRVVAGRLLTKAFDLDRKTARADCGPHCPARERSQIVYRVTPTAFLADEQQRDVCRQFESETRSRPLTFDQREFPSVDAMNQWIMEFSQGRGEDGRLLYARCSSNCSPRYTFLIAERTSGYAVKTEVLCGLARDKTNDVYLVSTAVRRSCALN